MIDKLIAYDLVELEKKIVLSDAKQLHRNKILTKPQWEAIKVAYHTKLFSPSVFMRILLFLTGLVGLSSISGPIGLIFSAMDFEITGYRVISFFVGVTLLLVSDMFFIQKQLHYKSGITEAGIYVGLSFLIFALVGVDGDVLIPYVIVGFIFCAITALRYLYTVSLLGAVALFTYLLYLLLSKIGGFAEMLMPFLFMAVFGLLFWSVLKLQKKYTQIIFEDLFVWLKSSLLILFYAAGNYFVVRELTIQKMGILYEQPKNFEIPLAFLFYVFTAILPMLYLFIGIKQKSVLFIRIGLIVLTASAITFKYYFSLAMPAITATVAGAILITISLLIFRYLRIPRNGFTGENLLQDKWSSPNVTAIIASQTLGGQHLKTDSSSPTEFGGGQFGGGGAGTSF